MAYRLFLTLMLLTASHGALGAQSLTGVVTGTVVDSSGTPAQQAIVLVSGGGGTLTDSTGRFVFSEVPVGRAIITAEYIGHDRDVAFVDVLPGVSVDVSLQFGRRAIPFSGAEIDYPERPHLEAATALLPRVLQDRDVVEWLEGLPSESVDSLVVWAPWMTGPNTVVHNGAAIFRVTRECGTCGVGFGHTVEGGRIYTVSRQHMDVGVRTLNTRAKQLEFSLAIAEPGERRLVHNPARAALFLVFVQSTDGSWTRLELDR
jgi:hypothetical protein